MPRAPAAKEHLPALLLFLLVPALAGAHREEGGRGPCLLVTLCSGRTLRAAYTGRQDGRLLFRRPGGAARIVDPRQVSRVVPCGRVVLPRQAPPPRDPGKEREARRLLARLASPRGGERQEAEVRLHALGPSIRPILRKALFAAAPEVRLRAGRVLARLERSFQRTVSKRAR